MLKLPTRSMLQALGNAPAENSAKEGARLLHPLAYATEGKNCKHESFTRAFCDAGTYLGNYQIGMTASWAKAHIAEVGRAHRFCRSARQEPLLWPRRVWLAGFALGTNPREPVWTSRAKRPLTRYSEANALGTIR